MPLTALLERILLLPKVGSRHHESRAGDEADNVGDNHQLVEHVTELPYQVVGGQSAQEDEDQRDGSVHIGSDLLRLGILAKEILHVDLAKHVPA